MSVKEILKEAFDSDMETLKMAYESDNKTFKAMYMMFSKLLIKLIQKQILSEEDMVEIISKSEIDKIFETNLEKKETKENE